MKKRYLLHVALGVFLFGYLEYRLGIRETKEALLTADVRVLLLGILAFLLSQAVRVVKWWLFHAKSAIETTVLGVCLFYFKLKLLGILTPGRIGEFIPAIASPGRHRGHLLSFTLYDRLTEATTTLVAAGLAFSFLFHGLFSRQLLAAAAGLLLLIVLFGYLCARNTWMMSLASAIGRRLEPHSHFGPVERILQSRKRIALQIRSLQNSFRNLFLPKTIAVIMSITFAGVVVDFLFWWLMFRTVGIVLTPSPLIAAIAIFNVSGFFSPTPGGIGVADSLFVIFLKSLGHAGAFGSFLLILRLVHFVLTALVYLLLRLGEKPPRDTKQLRATGNTSSGRAD